MPKRSQGSKPGRILFESRPPLAVSDSAPDTSRQTGQPCPELVFGATALKPTTIAELAQCKLSATRVFHVEHRASGSQPATAGSGAAPRAKHFSSNEVDQ